MICEEVAAHGDRLGAHVEFSTQELDEQHEQFHVRVDESDDVASLRAFRPVQHASGGVVSSTGSCKFPTELLVCASHVASGRSLSPGGDLRTETGALRELVLHRSAQLNVANP